MIKEKILYCYKNIGDFEKGKYYNAIFNEEKNEKYETIRIYICGSLYKYFSTVKNNIIAYYPKYFYTQNKLRKYKLKKLNFLGPQINKK